MVDAMDANTIRRVEPAVLVVACLLPTFVTLTYFVWAAGSPAGVQQAVYGAAKVVQFLLPVVWVGAVCRERLAWPVWNTRGLALGIAFGLLVSAALWVLYLGLAGTTLLNSALEPIREKISEIGVVSPHRFLALGVFYALIHSLLEEYYWRWFVFGRLRLHTKLTAAIVISSVAFAAHHVVVLWAYFAHQPVFALLLAACVAIGGVFWSWLYDRSKSIYSTWFSHLFVDAAIFAVGYDIARPIFD